MTMGGKEQALQTETAVETMDGKLEARGFRNALGRFATGITVITTRNADGKLEGLTANSFSALSLDPPLVLWSLVRKAPSLETFLGAGRFAINVLGAHQRAVSNHFATPAEDKFSGIDHVIGNGGCPVLADRLALFECVTEQSVDGGDHLLFIGRVIRAVYGDGPPLLYSAGGYAIAAGLPDDIRSEPHHGPFADLML